MVVEADFYTLKFWSSVAVLIYNVKNKKIDQN